MTLVLHISHVPFPEGMFFFYFFLPTFVVYFFVVLSWGFLFWQTPSHSNTACTPKAYTLLTTPLGILSS